MRGALPGVPIMGRRLTHGVVEGEPPNPLRFWALMAPWPLKPP